MTDRVVGFTATNMPHIQWHGEPAPVVFAIARVRRAEKIGEMWAVLLDREMRVDDVEGILTAIGMLGVLNVEPFKRHLAPRPSTFILQGEVVSHPPPPASTAPSDLAQWWADWESYDHIAAKLRPAG